MVNSLIRIRYKGWQTKYDETISYSDLGCWRLAPLGQHTSVPLHPNNTVWYRVGHYIQCYDTTDRLLAAQIIEIVQTPDLNYNYKITYIGWDPMYDELIPWNSSRIKIDPTIECGIQTIILMLYFIATIEQSSF